MKLNRLYIALLILLLASPSAMAQKKNVIDEVAWIVGDEPILLSDIERQRLYFESLGQKFEGDPRCIIPERIAIQKLFLNQAKIDSVIPNENAIAQAVNQWIDQMINELGSREKFEEYLGRNISQIREERRKIVREEYTVQQMQSNLVSNVKVSPSEVNRFYEKINKDSLPFIPTAVETQIITIAPQIPVSESDEIKERLRGYAEEVTSGKRDFSMLARIYSQDPGTALRGGELGFVGKAELEPEFAEVAFALQDPQKVSRVVKSAYGYHIIQLIERRGERINVRHILLRPEVPSEEMDKARARMDSVMNIMKRDSISFGDVARYVSSDEDSRNSNGQMVNQNAQSRFAGTSKFLMEDLPQEVSAQVAKLKVGEMSEPFAMKDKNGNDVIAVVRLKRKIEGHRANLVEDYQEINNIVTEKKRQEMIDAWIRDKQRSTYVRISPEYRGCTFQYPNWETE